MANQAIVSPPPSSGFLTLMRNRDYALLWVSQGISLVGDRFHWVAISLWVFAQTGSALSVSYAIVALMVGPAVVGLFAGVLVDRWNRKLTMILSDLVRGALVAMIPWLMRHDVKLVYLDLFLVSGATAFFRPAMLATIPRTVSRSDLLSANSFFTALDTATDVVGPILAGILVQASGYAVAMYLDTATYLVSALILVLLSGGQSPVQRQGRQIGGFSVDFKDVLRYIRTDRLQFGLLTLVLLGWWVSGLNSLQTPLAKGVVGLSDQQFGWFNGVWGAGLVLASLLMGWYGAQFPKGRLIAMGFLGWGVATGVMGFSANAAMLFVAAFWVGFANIVLFVSIATVIMEITPSDLLGRVITTRQIALALVRVLAMISFGVVADRVGVRQAIVSMASLSLLGVAVGLLLFPEVGRFGVPVNRELATSGHTLPTGPQRILRVLTDSNDPSYGMEWQRVANVATLLVASVAWAAVLLNNPRLAGYAVVLVLATIAFGLVRGWFSLHGSKNVRREVHADSREFQEGGRNSFSTGPTRE